MPKPEETETKKPAEDVDAPPPKPAPKAPTPPAAQPVNVAERAAKMAKRQLMEKTQGWARALGIKGDSLEEFEKGLAGLRAEREKTLPETEQMRAQVQELQHRLQQEQGNNARLRDALKKSERERKRQTEKQQAAEVEQEIKQAAAVAGLKDSDYALHLFRKHVVEGGSFQNDPKQFFESLKAKPDFKHLFPETALGAGPPAGAQAPAAGGEPGPGSAVPDQGAPPPAKPGAAGKAPTGNVGELSKKDFAERTQSRYGYRPTV